MAQRDDIADAEETDTDEDVFSMEVDRVGPLDDPNVPVVYLPVVVINRAMRFHAGLPLLDDGSDDDVSEIDEVVFTKEVINMTGDEFDLPVDCIANRLRVASYMKTYQPDGDMSDIDY